MKPIRKYLFNLLLLDLILATAGFLLRRVEEIPISDVLFQIAGFSAISVVIFIIFNMGQSKEPDSQTVHSFLAMGLKLLLEMIFALIWFVFVKKNSTGHVIVFFVLYLAFTLFLVFYILNILKNKHLKLN